MTTRLYQYRDKNAWSFTSTGSVKARQCKVFVMTTRLYQYRGKECVEVYLHRVRKSRIVQSVCCCSILNKTEMCRQMLIKFPNIKFNENPFSNSRFVT
jgi:hypothetical protein